MSSLEGGGLPQFAEVIRTRVKSRELIILSINLLQPISCLVTRPSSKCMEFILFRRNQDNHMRWTYMDYSVEIPDKQMNIKLEKVRHISRTRFSILIIGKCLYRTLCLDRLWKTHRGWPQCHYIVQDGWIAPSLLSVSQFSPPTGPFWSTGTCWLVRGFRFGIFVSWYACTSKRCMSAAIPFGP